MDRKKLEENIFFYKLPDIHKYWGKFFTIGILLIILGMLAIGFAKWATEFTVILLGLLLAGSGILQTINGFHAKNWSGFSLSLFLGLLYMIAGLLCIFRPIQSAVGLSLLIAVLLLVGGSFRLVSALLHRFDNWGWVVFSGSTAILLGFLILAEWPVPAIWVIGLFVGIDLLLTGWYWVWLSLAARK